MPKQTSTTVEPVLSPELTERRYVYNGESNHHSSEFASRGNRPVKRRKRSSFHIIMIIFAASLMIVFYVWNKIMVNRLVVEVDDLHNQYEKVLNTNEFLRAEINKKSNLERIGKISSEQLGLVVPKEQPVWFEVNLDRLEKLGK